MVLKCDAQQHQPHPRNLSEMQIRGPHPRTSRWFICSTSLRTTAILYSTSMLFSMLVFSLLPCSRLSLPSLFSSCWDSARESTSLQARSISRHIHAHSTTLYPNASEISPSWHLSLCYYNCLKLSTYWDHDPL